jgi:hypothetical protein
MSVRTLKIIIAAVLLVHGLGHGGAIGALVAIGRGVRGGDWRPARLWMFPSLGVPTATTIAAIFWVLSIGRLRGRGAIVLERGRSRGGVATACRHLFSGLAARHRALPWNLAGLQYGGGAGGECRRADQSGLAALASTRDVWEVKPV